MEKKRILPFYEVNEQDLELIAASFTESMKHLASIIKQPEKLMEFCFQVAWHDYTANKIILENLGHEGIDARIKFRKNHNAQKMAKAHCVKVVEKAQDRPVLFTQDGTPLINR